MGSFANSAFSVMLGWIRNLVTQGWSLLSNAENGSLLAWVGENWKALVLILCVGGIVIDFVVYLARWRPQKVWASFFRRLRGEGVEADDPEAVAEEAVRKAEARKQFRPVRPEKKRQDTQPTWVYPDGTARQAVGYEPEVQADSAPYAETGYEPVVDAYAAPMLTSRELSEQYVNQFARPDDRMPYEAPSANWAPLMMDAEQTVSLGAMGRSYRRGRSARHHENAEQAAQSRTLAAYEPPLAQVLTDRLAGYPQPKNVDVPIPALRELPENEPDAMSRPPKRVAAKVSASRLLGLYQDEDDVKLNYTPPTLTVDHRDAYHAPVYPPAWKASNENDTDAKA